MPERPIDIFDVFLSHNSKDKPAVRELASQLAARGLKVWLDEWELRPGLTWMDALEDIISVCRSAAVCVGPNGIGPWEEPEMRALLRRFVKERRQENTVPIIPTLLPGGPDDIKLPAFLEDFTWVDLRDGITAQGLDLLQWGITGEKPTGPVVLAEKPAPLSTERLAELTGFANEKIAAAANAWLDTECAPFVVPSLARHRMQHEPAHMMGPSRQRQPLADDEIETLVLGQLSATANRVRIVGDSGMGKTALLHYCQSRIATTSDGRLPVRIDGLSGCNWTLPGEEVLEWMVDRILHRYLPHDLEAKQAVLWLCELVHQGKVVFLLDALDQADRQLSEAGLRTFLQSAGVSDCPVLITLRPEVEASAVFSSVNWDTVHAEGFHEQSQQRQYLGEIADDLLPKDDEEWKDFGVYQRKQQWADLLQIPLLLKMLRDLASGQHDQSATATLSALRNRHAVYREAVAYLVRKGLESARSGPFRDKLYDAGEVDERLTEIGWATIAQGDGNFTATLDGPAFRELRKESLRDVDLLRALQQVDVITRHSMFDSYGEAGLAWRHRSFSEYYAGIHLARADAETRTKVAQRHARDPRWEWVFRFALSEIDSAQQRTGVIDDYLAQVLIQHGNPFVVYEALDGDAITLPDYLDKLCRWLVHRDWNWSGRNYTDAWQETDPPPFDQRWIEMLTLLFQRSFRDSRCLHAGWQLLKDCKEADAVQVREDFLAEFREMLSDTACPEHPVAQVLAHQDNFARCPRDPSDDGETFQMGSAEKEESELYPERPQHGVKISPFHLQRTPVSNVQFELFDPSHCQHRDEYSSGDDHPVIWVSWYMAEMFCIWLGGGYRLPREAEWEYAARAGTTTRYWWGDEFDTSKCHNADSGQPHTLAPDGCRANPWGLIDMLGNVWEWCLDGPRDYSEASQEDPVGPCDIGSLRVGRGGGWGSTAGLCRSACRRGYSPSYRIDFLGFRLALVPSGQDQGGGATSEG